MSDVPDIDAAPLDEIRFVNRIAGIASLGIRVKQSEELTNACRVVLAWTDGRPDDASAWRALFRAWMERAHHGSLTDGLNDFVQLATALHDQQVLKVGRK